MLFKATLLKLIKIKRQTLRKVWSSNLTLSQQRFIVSWCFSIYAFKFKKFKSFCEQITIASNVCFYCCKLLLLYILLLLILIPYNIIYKQKIFSARLQEIFSEKQSFRKQTKNFAPSTLKSGLSPFLSSERTAASTPFILIGRVGHMSTEQA